MSRDILKNAVRNGELERVKELLASNLIPIANSDGYRLLIDALKISHKEVAKLLLISGATVNYCLRKNVKSRPPLSHAIPLGDLELVELIINKGSEINYLFYGLSPLHLAVQHKQIAIAEYLLQRGAFVDIKDFRDITPLLTAAKISDNNNMIKPLEDLNVDHNSENNLGDYPLSLGTAPSNIDIINLLIRFGADVNNIDCRRNTALHVAAEAGNATAVMTLAAHNAQLCCQNCEGKTPLNLAIESGNTEVVKLLLGFKVDLNSRDINGDTALHIAAKMENINVVILLAAHDADLNSTNHDGETPLIQAISSGEIDMIELLLELGADVNCGDEFGNSPLHKTAQNGKIAIFEMLVANGAKSLINNANETPFHLALRSGNNKIAKLILNTFQVDANSTDYKNNTPLHYAARSSGIDIELIEMLLSRGAKVDPENDFCQTPFRIAVDFTNNNIVELLHSKGASVNCRDKNGVTPLHVASYAGYLELVSKLVSYGASLNSKVNDTDDYCYIRGEWEPIFGLTPLHWAIQAGRLEIVNVLLNAGADINIRDIEAITPFRIAILLGNTDIMSALLERGFDINSTDEDGMTALHLACKDDDLKMASFLLSNGANTEVTSKDKNFPIHIAANKKDVEMVQLLLQNGAYIDAKNAKGYTALATVTKLGCTATAETILKFEPNLELSFEQGNTVLHLGTYSGKIEMVNLLLKYGCNINAINYNGMTPAELCINYFPTGGWSLIHSRGPIRKVFQKHLVKLQMAEIPINPKNVTYLETGYKEKKFEDECILELIKMKEEKIKDTNISFYKFLTKDIRELAICVRNATLVENLEPQYCKTNFPIYCDMIVANLGKAKKRRDLSDKSLMFFNNLDEPTLPITCALEIISYLDNNDLENLIDSFSLRRTQ